MNTLTQKYQHQTDLEHVLSNPAMYIGSIAATPRICWFFEETIYSKEVEFHAALYKIIDEPLTNCYDHYVRTRAGSCPVTAIEISITKNTLTIQNDGEGIDVEIHPETKLYIPEMIFATMRTSTNYGPTNKLVGGLHGYGIKLTAAYSRAFNLTAVDERRGLKYTQEFGQNLATRGAARITKVKAARGLTKIVFEPDFARFKLAEFPDYMEHLVKKRAYDLSILMPNVKVKFNSKLLPRRTFKHYAAASVLSNKYALFEGEHWKVAAANSEAGFNQLSMVNGIETISGGRHIEYVLGLLLPPLRKLIKEKKKVDLPSRALREHLFLIVVCDVFDPKFAGQIKESLVGEAGWASPLSLPADFIEKTFKLVGDACCSLFAAKEKVKKNKEEQKLLVAGDGTKTRVIKGVPQLIDANLAGGGRSEQCTLIICEGESAATGVLSGLSSKDRDYYGVYPLRGKIVNPQDKGVDKIAANKIIIDIKKILGLESGKTYSDTRRLRYGRVVFMTDQDLDGHHIKALGLNVFYTLWESLLRRPAFFGFMQTPIIKARRGKTEKIFYHEKEYRQWREKVSDKWDIKYYKGLGTSTAAEFKQYFTNMKVIYFDYQEGTCEAFKTVFSKDSAARKLWLSYYDKARAMSIVDNKVTYKDFIDNELIHFSKYDCERSIPSIDGLKPSQRKILYTALAHLTTKEMKVAQFCGRAAELTHYHHGESNLEGAVVGMAQTFVGSNNLNLLLPLGQFGSRRVGGEDAASSRYIFTRLNPAARLIFRKEDEEVLEYLEDDGARIEPRHYIPIIPMILVNGAVGIGTGFSCTVLPHDPRQVIEATRAAIKGESAAPRLLPMFQGFKGQVEACGRGKYQTRGVYSLDSAAGPLTITELPVGLWTLTFKETLEELITSGPVESYIDGSTDTDILFKIKLRAGIVWTPELVARTFPWLIKKHSENNMYLFDFEDKLRKFEEPADIISYYVPIRLGFYEKRKDYMLKALATRAAVLENKVKYVRAILAGALDVTAKKAAIELELEAAAFDRHEGSFDYLLNMPIVSLSAERAAALEKSLADLKKEQEILRSKSPRDIWLEELNELAAALE